MQLRAAATKSQKRDSGKNYADCEVRIKKGESNNQKLNEGVGQEK